MKTPREVLFKKHQDMEAKLDSVRANAMAEIVPALHTTHHAPRHAGFWLQELIHSFRPHLAALAAVWLVIFGLHLASSETSGSTMVVTTMSSPEIMTSLKEQRRLYTQLIDPSEIVQPVLPDRRPRSEKQFVRIA
ncbi:MAG: hypothetical protein JWQ71_3994 [Pedosphaera sp.]|nr:hypothetical protein [Pedosphaera sp.]